MNTKLEPLSTKNNFTKSKIIYNDARKIGLQDYFITI